jgi:RNA polymerase sigma factor (sigma-70 family)
MLESENILLRRFVAAGDAQAFSEIVRRHAGLVYGACLRVLEDKDKAADAVQETFLQLLRNAKDITGSVPTWLHRVATRRAIDVIRRDSSRKQREKQYAADRPREVTQWHELSRYIDEGLDTLDDQAREILIERFFQGRTTTDIADEHGLSQATVSRRIESGVTMLRQGLRKRGIIVAIPAMVSLLGENAVEAAPALVIKELGKIALVGGKAAAAGAGVKTAGILAGIGVKAKIITAVTVTAVTIGSVVTYNHVTHSRQGSRAAQQDSQRQSERQPIPAEDINRGRETTFRNTDSASSTELDVEQSNPEQSNGETTMGGYAVGGYGSMGGGMGMGGMMGGYGGMGMGGYGGSIPDGNDVGGYGGMMGSYGGYSDYEDYLFEAWMTELFRDANVVD